MDARSAVRKEARERRSKPWLDISAKTEDGVTGSQHVVSVSTTEIEGGMVEKVRDRGKKQ